MSFTLQATQFVLFIITYGQGSYVFALFVCLFVCLLAGLRNVAHGPRKKRLDFGGNMDRVELGLALRWELHAPTTRPLSLSVPNERVSSIVSK